ncbi:MAG: VOC family protein [Burkholderiaceae bacterium]|nr:VOC family protein [Burkholderiaceae bacterium]
MSDTTDPDPWRDFDLELDHLVIAAGSLGAGSAWLQERFGVALQPGGRHPGWGTHNRLLNLANGTYLELIAPDPTQPPPARARPFGLDRPDLRARIARQPCLVHFVMRTPRLQEAIAAIGYDPGPVSAMSRGDLRWRITLPGHGNPCGNGLLPTLIQWEVDRALLHPAKVLQDRGVALEELRVVAPPAVLRLLRGIERDPRLRLDPETGGRGAGLRAEFATPNGPVTLQ